MCPNPSSKKVRTCVDDCSVDRDCKDGFKCCDSGCGHTCAVPVSIPYHTPPLACPAVSSGMTGDCSEECGNGCTKTGEICCSNGCGHACMQGVTPPPLCLRTRESILNRGESGQYIPQCEKDGSFISHQCHSEYCWCVDPNSGVPVSDKIRFQKPQCSE